MPDGEVEMLFQTLLDTVRSDEEIIEVSLGFPSPAMPVVDRPLGGQLLSQMPPHLGGLLPLGFGLLHPSGRVRLRAVEFLKRLDSHPTGSKFCQNLNAFHRLAFLRQDEEQSSSEYSSMPAWMHIPDPR